MNLIMANLSTAWAYEGRGIAPKSNGRIRGLDGLKRFLPWFPRAKAVANDERLAVELLKQDSPQGTIDRLINILTNK